MNTRSIVGIILIVAIGAAGYYWYQHRDGTATETGSAAPMDFAMPVEATAVRQEALVRRIVAVGSLLANEDVMLRPEFEGKVVKIHFNEGQKVSKGDLLVTLDDSIYEAELKQADARLKLSEANTRRINSLRKKGLSNEQEEDQAISELGVNKASQVLARTRLKKMAIHAPFDGTIGLRSISEGDYLSSGQDIVTLINDNPIKLEFRVPEVLLSEVAIGQQVDVRVDAFRGETFNGEVYAIAPQVDVGGRSFMVRAQIPNDDGRLVPGLFAQVELELERKEDALLIPEAALMPAGDKQYVYRIVEGKAVRSEVSLGLRQGDLVEVISGLEPDAQVITAGQMKIMDGSSVQPLGGDTGEAAGDAGGE
ncbi:MAG: efflux RND transporter periplasmic adaptor subunit [Thiotrichales bacterium]|nr:MAG: efflux RND transporter periplasmic adaptor subunit [Thiotrichales bacterium]